MKLTIVSSGSRGDIQPYIALGIGLQKSGHDVTIATHGNFKDFVEENGLKILEMVGNPKEILDSEQGKAMLESGSNPFKSMPMLIDLFKTHLGKFFDGLIEKLEGTEAVIFTTTTFQSYYIAKKLGIPSIAAYLLPFSNTSEFPNIFVPNPHKLGFIYNKMTHLMMEQLLWQPFRKITNEWLTKELKLEPIPFLGNLGGRNTDLFPIVYGFSPSVIPKPKDWNDSVHITGYWFLDKAEEYIPEPKLKDFIESDKAPIYIGFGSMTNRHPEQVASIVIEALNKTGQRGILLSGWGGMSNDDLPDNILMVDSVPHDWLFPKMSSVIHHCGAGTTASGLRAGVPTIPIPFFADQPFWANKMYDLGLSAKPILRKNLSVDSLINSINYVTKHNFIKENCLHIKEKINQEDGIDLAVKKINQFFAANIKNT